MAMLPGLLARLKPEDVDAATLSVSDTVAAQAASVIARQRRSERRRLWMWRSIAAAATVVTIIALAGVVLPVPQSAGDHYVVRPVAPDAGRVAGDAVVEERDWGMVVDLDLGPMPDRRGFVLWAVASEDHRVRVASWRAVENRSVGLTGSCYLDPSEVIRLEVTTPDEELLLTLERQ